MINSISNCITEKQIKLFKKIKYFKNEVIFNEDDYCDSLCIISKGQAIIASYSFFGKEVIFKELNKNDMFGNNLIFSSAPFYKGKIIAKNSCEVLKINKTNLLKLLKENNEFLNQFMQINADESLYIHKKIRVLAFANASDRLIYLLHINNNVYNYKTITSLASELSITRECLSRVISKLIKDKTIQVNNKTIKYLL